MASQGSPYLEVAASDTMVDMPAVAPKKTAPAKKEIHEGSFATMYRKFSYIWSFVLMIFAISVVFYGVGRGWNNPPWSQKDSHGALECVILFLMLYWIALLEGCQISIVGLQNVNMENYKDSHPRAYAVAQTCFKGPNVEKFLVGRQFLLLFNGFLVGRVGGLSADKFDEFKFGEWEFEDKATQFFIINSFFLLIVLLVPAQLVSQLMAAEKMMAFLDLRFVASMYTVVYPCFFIESLGFTHSTYVLKDTLAWATGLDPNEADPKKKMNKNFMYYLKCFWSCSWVIFGGIFLVKGWIMGQTGATSGAGWRHLPGGLAVVVSIFFLFIMACAEGLQVSALALAKVKTSEFKDKSPLAYRTCQLLYAGRNMQAFLVGRQFMVALMVILLGRVCGYAGSGGVLQSGKYEFQCVNSTEDIGSGCERERVEKPGDDWGMGEGFNEWGLQSGFIGAIFVVNVAQLMSQVTASIFPIGFINNRILNWLLRVMLFIESTGIASACWPMAWFFDWLLNLHADPYEEEDIPKTLQQQMIDRKISMGIPITAGTSPFDLHQPEQEYHVEYTYRVSFI